MSDTNWPTLSRRFRSGALCLGLVIREVQTSQRGISALLQDLALGYRQVFHGTDGVPAQAVAVALPSASLPISFSRHNPPKWKRWRESHLPTGPANLLFLRDRHANSPCPCASPGRKP